jgi:hypothetical protein
MTKDEALDLALRALRFARDDGYENEVSQEAITAIKQARSAPVQEPVAWMNPHGGFLSASYIDKFASGLDKEIHNIPLYTTPPAQPAPVQPVAWAIYQRGRLQSFWLDKGDAYDFEFTTEHQWQPLYTTPPAALVAWKWHQAPFKTSWGHEMVVADLAIDKDNTVSVYCERDQTTKVEAMFTPPAQPTPLEKPFGYFKAEPFGWTDCAETDEGAVALYEHPAAQRPWIGLSDEEADNFLKAVWGREVTPKHFIQAIEAKLKELNT